MTPSLITAECWGGIEDGLIIHSEPCKVTIFRRPLPGKLFALEESTYALEALEDGRFRWRHVATHEVSG